jgi:RNA-splicing ligase RtcB
MNVNKESEGMWEEMATDYFKVLEGLTKTMKTLFRIQIPGLDSNQVPPKSKSHYCYASQLEDFVQYAFSNKQFIPYLKRTGF